MRPVRPGPEWVVPDLQARAGGASPATHPRPPRRGRAAGGRGFRLLDHGLDALRAGGATNVLASRRCTRCHRRHPGTALPILRPRAHGTVPRGSADTLLPQVRHAGGSAVGTTGGLRMRVLVACEFSGIVRDAFLARHAEAAQQEADASDYATMGSML